MSDKSLNGMKEVTARHIYIDTTKYNWKEDAMNIVDILTRHEYAVACFYEDTGFIIEFSDADTELGGPRLAWIDEDDGND